MFAALPHALIVESGEISLIVCQNGVKVGSQQKMPCFGS
jgi:hypothetical protein